MGSHSAPCVPIIKHRMERNKIEIERTATPKRNTGAAQSLLLSVREVAQELRLCTNTIYTLMDRGELPYVRVFKRKMVARETLTKFIASHEVNSLVQPSPPSRRRASA